MKLFSFNLDTSANMFMKTGERKKKSIPDAYVLFWPAACIMHWVYKIFHFLTHLTDPSNLCTNAYYFSEGSTHEADVISLHIPVTILIPFCPCNILYFFLLLKQLLAHTKHVRYIHNVPYYKFWQSTAISRDKDLNLTV
jgi:hypothetical protein